MSAVPDPDPPDGDARGGPIDIDHGGLGCRYHHRHAKQQGWTTARSNARAAWIPSRWIDPEQQPRYNNLHSGAPP